MRIFRISEGSEFIEYHGIDFPAVHDERTVESWLEQNPDSIMDDGGILLIGRQVSTNLGTTIDLMGVDRDGDAVVVELKRGKTPRDTLAQALEYASFVHEIGYEQLNDLFQAYAGDVGQTLADAHRELFQLSTDEAVSFNKDQHIVLVGTEMTAPIIQTCEYLNSKGVRVTCVEFSYYSDTQGGQLMSMDPTVKAGHRPSPTTVASPKTNEAIFLAACDDAGRALFGPIIALAKSAGFMIRWGQKGFSLWTDDVSFCQAYPLQNTFIGWQQKLIIMFAKISEKLASPEDLVAKYTPLFRASAPFVNSGEQNLKCSADSVPDQSTVDEIVNLIAKMGAELRGLETH